MVGCCIDGCSNRSARKTALQVKEEQESKTRISFHRFPEDKRVRQSWIEVIGRKDWVPKQSTCICSDHFTKDCFDVSPFYKKLTKTAVPTVLPQIFPVEYCCTSLDPNQEPLQCSSPNEEEITSKARSLSPAEISDPLESILPLPEVAIHLVAKTTSFSPDRRKSSQMSPAQVIMMRNYKVKLCAYKKKIKTLQQKTRRQAKRIEKLENVVKELKSKTSISKNEFEEDKKEYYL